MANQKKKLKRSTPLLGGEQEFQYAQASFQKGEINLALEWGRKALQQKKLHLGLKLKVIDLIGLCYRHSYSDKEVYLHLSKSIKYLERYPSEPFAFSIYSNYLEALIALGFQREACEEFEDAPKYLKKMASKDELLWLKHYLIIRKLRYLFAKKYETAAEAWIIIEAINEMAHFTNDSQMIAFAQEELKLYNFDEGKVSYFQDWIYLQEDRLALFTKEKKISRLATNKTIQNIIGLLLRGPIKTKEFFKIVTKETYIHELHHRSLARILSKVRESLADNCIIIHNGQIALL